MKIFTLFFLSSCCSALAQYNWLSAIQPRYKRDVSGALDIVSNTGQQIHADVKPENEGVTEKPCPKSIFPSQIEGGTVFQVTPPKDALYMKQSLRKSWPLTGKLDLMRSVTRVVTLAILVLSAAVEFYPLIQHLYALYYV